jgi:hypothetical protein
MAPTSSEAARGDWNSYQKSCAAEYKAMRPEQKTPSPAAPTPPSMKAAGPGKTKSETKKLVQKQVKTEARRQRLTGKQSAAALNRGSASSDAFRRERDAANTEATRKRLREITRHSDAENVRTKAFKSVSDQLRDGRAGKPSPPGLAEATCWQAGRACPEDRARRAPPELKSTG